MKLWLFLFSLGCVKADLTLSSVQGIKQAKHTTTTPHLEIKKEVYICIAAAICFAIFMILTRLCVKCSENNKNLTNYRPSLLNSSNGLLEEKRQSSQTIEKNLLVVPIV